MKECGRPLRWWWLVLIDFGALCAALLIFALFHHVLPRKGEAQTTILSMAAPTAAPAPAVASPSALPTPEPVYAIGDFSATFPASDTTAPDAIQSYQSDNIRISVSKVRDEENSITSYVADIWVRNRAFLKTAFADGQYGKGFSD